MTWVNRILDGPMKGYRVDSLLWNPYISEGFFGKKILLGKKTLNNITTLRENRTEERNRIYDNINVAHLLTTGTGGANTSDYKNRYYLVELDFKSGEKCTARIHYKIKRDIERKMK